MDSDSFKDFAKEMVEYITNYLENIRDRWIFPIFVSIFSISLIFKIENKENKPKHSNTQKMFEAVEIRQNLRENYIFI